MQPIRIRVVGVPVSAFRLAGVTGFLAGSGIALALVSATGGSVPCQLAIAAFAAASFLGLAHLTRRLSGRERLVYFHHHVAVLTGAAAVAAAFGAPVAEHLDASAVGLALFLSAGRLGCLAVGCCHGRPSRRGVVYTRRHALAGLPGYFAGCRLLPVQALESAGACALAAAGAGAVLAGAYPGSAFELYVVGYALLRIALEELRGDTERATLGPLSEAQWESLGTIVVVATLAVAGALPHAVAVASAGALAAPEAAVAASRRSLRSLLDPAHVVAVERLLNRRDGQRPLPTPLGVKVSHGRTDRVAHYSFSPASAREAEVLGELVLALRHPHLQGRLVAGPAGVFHLVVEDG